MTLATRSAERPGHDPVLLRNAIQRLRKRIEEIAAFHDEEIKAIVDPLDPAALGLEKKINATLADIFGEQSEKYKRFGELRLYGGAYNVAGVSVQVAQDGFTEGALNAMTSLEALLEVLEERLEAITSQDGRPRPQLRDFELHPEIARATIKLFNDGHYANAVENACKALDGLVKLRSGRNDLSGTELMQTVFSMKNPVIRFSPMSTDSDRSEQQGFMFLFSGIMLAFRNPRAHGLVVDTAEMAFSCIVFISLLARRLDAVDP